MWLRWYADNSELVGWRGAPIQNMLLFGGIVIDIANEAMLREKIEQTKEKYGARRAPVKWNFKDLRSDYEKEGLATLFDKLLSCSKDWRREMVQRALEIPFTIFVSCIESHSLERKIIKLRKRSLGQYAFSNALMRVGLHAQQAESTRTEVLLDWPDKQDPKPFDLEYMSALNHGKTLDQHVKYHCGPLKDIRFADSVTYATMNHCTLLQFSDLVLGAAREFIEYAIGKREGSLGIEIARTLKDRFYGSPQNISGRGITVSSGNGTIRKMVRDAIVQELQ